MEKPNFISKLADKLTHEIKALTGDAAKHKLFIAEQVFASPEAAQKEFAGAKQRLFAVNKWSEISALSSTFTLHNRSGIAVSGKNPEVGDFIKIELPAAKTKNWVQVQEVKTAPGFAEFTVRPSTDPNSPDPKTEHFFSSDATSTFRVELEETTVRAFEIGLNEFINNQGSEAGKRAAVNTVIAEGGWAFFQKIQWQSLTDYLAGKKE